MANPLNFKKNHADVVAAEAVLAPLLVSANITSIKIEGKDVAVSDPKITVAEKITALGYVIATGSKTEDSAAAIAANGELATQNEVLEGKLVAAKATNDALTAKNLELSGKLTVANDSVTTLTAKNLELNNLLTSTTQAAERLTKDALTQKTDLAKDCLAIGCLNLVGDDGKALAVDAAEDVKLAAAMKLPASELSKYFKGAVTSAIANVGISAAVPAAGGKLAAKVPGEGLSGIAKVEAQIAAQIAGQIPVKK